MSILLASNVDFTNIGMDSMMKPVNFYFHSSSWHK